MRSKGGDAGLWPLQDAVVRILKTRPFYGHLLLALRRRISAAESPLGVTLENGTPTLELNPRAFEAFSSEEQEALLEHVLKHVLHLHMLRRKERHSRDWDIACDLAINPGIEGLPPGALLPVRFKASEGLAAEEYYALLHAHFAVGNLEGGGVGDASKDFGGGLGEANAQEAISNDSPALLDDHRIWAEAESTPVRLAEEVVRTMVSDAVRKSHGEIPGEVRPLVEGWLAPSAIPWRQVLRQFVATAGRVGRQSTWTREHRRFSHDTPGMRKRRRLHLLVGVDVSDSTNIRELREAFAAELMRIARGRDSLLTVLYAGSRIQKIEAFRGTDIVAEVYEGGGFTDLRPVFDHARTLNPRPAAVIYLTDGFGEAPKKMEFPTLWVLTKEGEKPAPWGVELRLDR